MALVPVIRLTLVGNVAAIEPDKLEAAIDKHKERKLLVPSWRPCGPRRLAPIRSQFRGGLRSCILALIRRCYSHGLQRETTKEPGQ